ncbi:SapC family protein [Magnetofaba australis]|nr:SapC family protein [Magnetofaba australis]
MYQNVEPLIAERHSALRLSAQMNAAFALKSQNAPLTDIEFFSCAHSHPILFAKTPEDETVAIALMGLSRANNLYVDPQTHQWREATYMPAFFRRYPFIQMKDEKGERSIVGMDMACPAVNDESGARLFEEDGKPSPTLDNAIKFLATFEAGLTRMKAFAAELDKLELLVPSEVEWQRGDIKSKFSSFLKVDEQKLDALSEEQILPLIKNGYYKLIMAHLFSQENFRRMIELSNA